MKITPLLLAGSLVANAVLLGFIFLRSPAAQAQRTPITAKASTKPSEAAGGQASALEAALAAGDPAAIEAAGGSPELVRTIRIGRAFDSFQAAMRASRPKVPPESKYWRNPKRPDDPATIRNQRIESNKAQRDFSEAVRLAYGEDLDSLFSDREARFSFLPAAKREQLRRIEQDYAELEMQIQSSIHEGIQLPADREKLELLRREKERDIAAALSPAEREQLELRTSPAANLVRSQFGDVLQTEEEFKKIYALQKAFSDQFNQPDLLNAATRLDPEAARLQREARSAAQRKLEEQIRAALTPEQIATLQRTNDPDRRTVTSLAQRLDLPASSVDAVLATRELYAAQSLQINSNPALTPQERRTQIQSLATKSQVDLQATLGADGAQAYAQRAPWLNMLKGGNAFSTNPKDAPTGTNTLTSSVFQVSPPMPPPRTPPPGGG